MMETQLATTPSTMPARIMVWGGGSLLAIMFIIGIILLVKKKWLPGIILVIIPLVIGGIAGHTIAKSS